MKTYHVSANRRLGFWIVMENNAGHYRQVARYSTQNAAAKAAETLSTPGQPPSRARLLLMRRARGPRA